MIDHQLNSRLLVHKHKQCTQHLIRRLKEGSNAFANGKSLVQATRVELNTL